MYNELIKVYAKAQKTEDMLQIHKEMKQVGILCNHITYSTIIVALNRQLSEK